MFSKQHHFKEVAQLFYVIWSFIHSLSLTRYLSPILQAASFSATPVFPYVKKQQSITVFISIFHVASPEPDESTNTTVLYL